MNFNGNAHGHCTGNVQKRRLILRVPINDLVILDDVLDVPLEHNLGRVGLGAAGDVHSVPLLNVCWFLDIFIIYDHGHNFFLLEAVCISVLACDQSIYFLISTMDSDANDTRPIRAVLEVHCSILTEMADGDFILQMKLGKDVNTAFEICSLCEKKFVTEDYLKKHILKVHLNDHSKQFRDHFECSYCEEKFKENKLLDYHIRGFHLGEKVKCHKCGKYVHLINLTRHNRQWHQRIQKLYEAGKHERIKKLFEADFEEEFPTRRKIHGLGEQINNYNPRWQSLACESLVSGSKRLYSQVTATNSDEDSSKDEESDLDIGLDDWELLEMESAPTHSTKTILVGDDKFTFSSA